LQGAAAFSWGSWHRREKYQTNARSQCLVPLVVNFLSSTIHALSIPVRLEVAFMAQAKIPIWTIEHSLFILECAVLLKGWLEVISLIARSCGIESL